MYYRVHHLTRYPICSAGMDRPTINEHSLAYVDLDSKCPPTSKIRLGRTICVERCPNQLV
jgi:hypothetical protein